MVQVRIEDTADSRRDTGPLTGPIDWCGIRMRPVGGRLERGGSEKVFCLLKSIS